MDTPERTEKERDAFVIMLVDDQAMVAEAVRRILLSQPDFEFHYCSEGAKALDTAIELQPLVILQDLVMPDGDGISLLKAYRKHPVLRNTPVVVLSVQEDPAVKKQAFEAGAHDYMVKLPDPIEFVARVRHHAEGCLADRQLAEAMRALRESQQQTIERNIELEKINEQKNRLLGMAAHDLRNPIGVVLNFSEFLMT
jgi:two-component system chemotaxis family response regulator WspR